MSHLEFRFYDLTGHAHSILLFMTQFKVTMDHLHISPQYPLRQSLILKSTLSVKIC